MVVVNVGDYQVLCRERVPRPLYEYLASGTDDEQTLSENTSAYKQIYLRPRSMRPVGDLSTRTSLFGSELDFPVFVSPAGVHALCHDEGECATSRACARHGTMFGLSQHSTRSIEDVADATRHFSRTNNWYQSYILKDRDATLRLVRRAVMAGYKGIFLTVDSVRFGFREADARNGWSSLPPPHRLVNYDESPETSNLHSSSDKSKVYNAKESDAWDQNTERLFEDNPTWDDVSRLKDACGDLPLVVKGIMTAEDALAAVNAGADGIMISNHGGRALDGCLASIDVLPEIAEAVGDRVPILLDGGIRRGTDVLKALALGATCVGIGKPIFFALAVGGEDAVFHVLSMLKTELESAMALCGARTVQDITEQLVTRHPHGGGHAGRYMRAKL